MKMLTLSALFACVLLPQTVSPSWFQETNEAYQNFAAWLTAPGTGEPKGSLTKVCTALVAESDHNPKNGCNEAAKEAKPDGTSGPGQDWGVMCTALGQYQTCPTSTDVAYTTAIGKIHECCLNICNNPTKAGYTDGENDQCCADCCNPAAMPTTKAAPPPTSQTTTATANSNSGDGESTTMQPTPSPGPTPSSHDSGDDHTTTEEPTTTEGGSDSDSAINIGASGLLVTLITMMAAGVNIA